jgi:hypothetical protein
MSHQVEKDGKMAFGFKTAYGDGCFTGSNDFDYGVDSGSIGLIHVDITSKCSVDLCTLVTFDKPTVCTNDNGRMKFGNIRINTK